MFSYAGSVTPCQTTGDCHFNCSNDGTPICAHNTCYCQRCNLYPPLVSYDEEPKFITKKMSN
ncbi:hypothetical protein H5410_042838 [Solanum commersonii]|uniref:Uncharacterized protein n=1 Tax=Solanum commersonii TaxID=4109 RepID=A0A9J5XYU0_SOLCO|nr:hypothetical protein H5410_042838 [Solanum commersonii]